MSARIEDYGFIGDMRTGALVGRDGAIEWLCLPRFDAEATFASILGDRRNGAWELGPCVQAGEPAPLAVRRRYRGHTLILESEWDTDTGSVRVTDFMPPWEVVPGDDAAQVVRLVDGVSGHVAMRSMVSPRFGYGAVEPWLRDGFGPTGGSLAWAVAGPDALWLHASCPIVAVDQAFRSGFTVAAGERVAFSLGWVRSHQDSTPAPADAPAALLATERFWADWVDRCTYEGPYRDAVIRSLITLKAFTYRPSGGIVGSLTTSLPQVIGGSRNWDYRYTWLRDSTVTLAPLLRTGHLEEADAWRRWLVRAVGGDPEQIRIMYGIGGERRIIEDELTWLPGYQDSRPVRVGNSAADQVQLDVYGEVGDLFRLARTMGLPDDAAADRLQIDLVHVLQRRWREPDDGIWESRGARAHFVHSKVMVWVAMDRAVKLLEDRAMDGPLTAWRGLRDAIHREVCDRGFDADAGTFVRAYGSPEVDAALLVIPQVGFLPADDPRVRGTVEAVQRRLLVDRGLVVNYRPNGVDGLQEHEGAFLACSFWLVRDLAMEGRTEEARRLFETLLGLRNDLGLLAEEWDPRLSRQVGNFPQAFSHGPLVEAALEIAGADPGSSR